MENKSKRFLSLLLALVMVIGMMPMSVLAEETAVDITTGLIGYYDFETVNDDGEVVNGATDGTVNGTLLDGAVVATVPENDSNNALYVTNWESKEGMYLTDILNTSTSSFSVSMWYKMTGSTNWASNWNLIQASNAAGGQGRTILVLDPDGQYYTYLTGDETKTRTSAVEYTNWQHVTLTYDKDTKKASFYINGTLDATATLSGSAHDVSDIIIGCHRASNQGYFYGYIDEVRVYNTVVSADVAKAIYADKACDIKGHSYVAGETVAPDCENDGYTTYTCSVCGDSYNEAGEAALGHRYSVSATVEATCGAAGRTVYTCSVCNGSYTETIPATGEHTNTEEYTLNTNPASCESTGSYSKALKCNDCGTILNTWQEEIPAKGHKWNDGEITTPAGCETAGVMTYTCQNVKSHTYTEEIPATGHTWVDATVDAPKTCSVCQATEGEALTAVAQVGETKYATLAEAVEAAKAGDNKTVTLLTDITMPALGEDVSEYDLDVSGLYIDLSGNTLTVPKLALVFVGENFTITGGTIKAEGADYALWIGGDTAAKNVTIDSVTVVGGINVYNSTNVTLKNNTVTNSTKYYAVWADNDVSNLVIESGSYTGADGYAAILTKNSEIVVKGGYFSTAVDAAYCAEGYEPVQYGDGSYGVCQHANTAPTAAEVPAGCETTGMTAGSYCVDCSTILIEQKVIPALGHDWNEGEVTLPTASAKGVITYTCNNDDTHTKEVEFALPTATVTDYPSSTLTFARTFTADEVSEESLAIFGNWHADFVLTLNKTVTFNANGNADGYLSGQYDSYKDAWLSVPFEDVTVQAYEPLYLMDYADEAWPNNGLRITYNDVITGVKVFNCGVYFTPEFLAANPDLVVNLELRIYDGDTPETTTNNILIGESENYNAPTVVAKVGDVGYATLAEAVAAAEAGATVTLLKDTTGAGVVINKDITIDLNDCTYTFNKAVGSTGTETLGFQIKKGNDVTIKNGTLTSTAVTEGNEVKVLIQNYANLTLTDVNLVDSTEHVLYALSNNSGTVVLDGSTSISTDAVAFDVYDFSAGGYTAPTVSVNTTGTITGAIEVSETISTNLNISAGTFSVEIDEDWCAEGFVPNDNGDGTYGVVEDPLFEITASSMTMANSLNMNFAFAQDHVADWTGHYAVIEKTDADGATVSQTVAFADWKSTTINDVAHYYVTFTGIAAKEMSDEIRVTIYNADGEAVSKVWVDSVRAQAMRNLANNVSDLNNTMVVDMLNYGAAAQTNASYNLENLANGLLTDAQKAYATASVSYENNMTFTSEGKYLANVHMLSNIQFMMAFSGIDTSMKAVVTYTKWNGAAKEITIDGSEFVQNGSYYVITIEETVIADGRQDINCKIVDSEGNTVAEVTDSMASYAARTTKNPELYEAIMKFSDSAKAYLSNK